MTKQDINEEYVIPNTEPAGHRIWEPPAYVGAYILGNSQAQLNITLTYKPNFFHRYFMNLFLGLKWKDYENK